MSTASELGTAVVWVIIGVAAAYVCARAWFNALVASLGEPNEAPREPEPTWFDGSPMTIEERREMFKDFASQFRSPADVPTPIALGPDGCWPPYAVPPTPEPRAALPKEDS